MLKLENFNIVFVWKECLKFVDFLISGVNLQVKENILMDLEMLRENFHLLVKELVISSARENLCIKIQQR